MEFDAAALELSLLFLGYLGLCGIDIKGQIRNNLFEYSNFIKERPPCLVVRKESARRWRHISEKRCLEEIGIRASN